MHHKIMFAAAIGLVAILLYVMSAFWKVHDPCKR